MLEVDENTPTGMVEVCVAVKGPPPPESFRKRVELTYRDKLAVGKILPLIKSYIQMVLQKVKIFVQVQHRPSLSQTVNCKPVLSFQ